MVSIQSFGQTGCRRISDGVLFQNQIFLSQDYNANQPFNGDVSKFCLPFGNAGTSCRIRIPGTTTSYQGTYGSYSAINCGLDHYAMGAMLISGIFVMKKIRRKSILSHKSV